MEPINIKKQHLADNQYYPMAQNKTMLIWHHTAGMTAAGALSWWDQTPERVGTPYLIERDGTIIECFDPSFWAYHIGMPKDDNFIEYASVPVEIVSAGYLTKEADGTFWFYPLFPKKIGGQKIPKEDVLEFEYKGMHYWHKYTKAQLESIGKLTTYILTKFPNIKVQDKLEGFWELNPDIATKHTPGIWAHSTFISYKSDLIPYPEVLKVIYDAAKPFQKQGKVENKELKK